MTRIRTRLRAAAPAFSLAALTLLALAPSAARAQTQDLYVGNGSNTTILRFAGTGPGTFSTVATPLTASSPGLDGPFGLAFDAHSNLYVTNQYFGNSNLHGSITEFAATATSGTFGATTNFTDPSLQSPSGLAFDSQGDLFVGNSYFNGSISEFAATATPGTFGAVTALSSGPTVPGALAFDTHGDLFAADTYSNGISITEYAAGATPGTFGAVTTLSGGLAFPTALAFDSHGDLFVANFYGGSATLGSITEFAATATPGTFGAVTSFTDQNLITPESLAFDANGDLFAGSGSNGKITEFAATATPGVFAPGQIVESGLQSVSALAFAPLAPPAVPEASTTVSFGLMLAFGLGGLVLRARAKKRSA